MGHYNRFFYGILTASGKFLYLEPLVSLGQLHPTVVLVVILSHINNLNIKNSRLPETGSQNQPLVSLGELHRTAVVILSQTTTCFITGTSKCKVVGDLGDLNICFELSCIYIYHDSDVESSIVSRNNSRADIKYSIYSI